MLDTKCPLAVLDVSVHKEAAVNPHLCTHMTSCPPGMSLRLLGVLRHSSLSVHLHEPEACQRTPALTSLQMLELFSVVGWCCWKQCACTHPPAIFHTLHELEALDVCSGTQGLCLPGVTCLPAGGGSRHGGEAYLWHWHRLEEATCTRAGSAGLGSGPGPTMALQACASSGGAQDRAGMAFKRLEELWGVQKAVLEVQSPAKSLGELLRVQPPVGEAGRGEASEADAEALQALQQLLLPQATGAGPPPAVPSADSSSPAGAAVVGASATSSELGAPSPGVAPATAEQQQQQVALLAKLSSLPALATSDLQALLAANAQQQQQGSGQGKGAARARRNRVGLAGAARRDRNVADQVRHQLRLRRHVQWLSSSIRVGRQVFQGMTGRWQTRWCLKCTPIMSHCCLRSQALVD